MTSRRLAAIGLVSYIFAIVSSAKNLDGSNVFGDIVIAISSLLNFGFYIFAVIRLWRPFKITAIAFLVMPFALFLYPSFLLSIANLLLFLLVLSSLWTLGGLEKQFEQTRKRLGLSQSEAIELAEELSHDRSKALDKLEAIQQEAKDKYKSLTGIDPDSIIIEIGPDVSWSDVINQVFRVHDFDRNGSIVDANGKVKASSSFQPYGYLLVETPILNNLAYLPITHKADFALTWQLFGEDYEAQRRKSELLVVYSPKTVLPGGLAGGLTHVLHFALTPKGTLESYYAQDNDIHMAFPQPERIFGKFSYYAVPKVVINNQPNL